MGTAQKIFWYAFGVILLPIICLLRLWEPSVSTVNPFGRAARPIDKWRWQWVQRVYGNFEDGVSGAFALIWVNGERVLYMPNAWAPWRALCWNFRNPIHNLNHPAE